MKYDFTYCGTCNAPNPYEVKDELITGEVDGVKYSYMGKRARCKKCGSVVTAYEVDAYNLKTLQKTYEGQTGSKADVYNT